MDEQTELRWLRCATAVAAVPRNNYECKLQLKLKFQSQLQNIIHIEQRENSVKNTA